MQQVAPDSSNGNATSKLITPIAYSFSRIPVYATSAIKVQPKLIINKPGDIYEQEADATADKIMRMKDNHALHPFSFKTVIPSIQRKCAHCEAEEKKHNEEESLQLKSIGGLNVQRKCSACEEEEEKSLQRKAFGTTPDATISPVVKQTLQSPGQAMDNPVRSFMEQKFGYNLGNVRIHNDNLACRSSSAIQALAYTHQNHVVFGAGQYHPETESGKHLLAHELTHVVQQTGDTIFRQEATTPTSSPQAEQAAYIVEDSDAPAAGQMRKSDFLRLLNEEVCRTVDQALQGTRYSSGNCPYIRAAFSRHSNSTPFKLEQLLRRYEPSTLLARNAQGLIQMVLVRVAVAVERWKRTGDLPGVPEEISAQIRGSRPAIAGAASGAGVSFKANPGGAHTTQSPMSVMQRLGKGSTLDSTTRGRMESTFGSSFSNVEIHTDSQASVLSNDMNARAFTVGNHIAFGSGEYKPGTLIGDALIAHELAHVVQQGNAKTDIPSNSQKGAFNDIFLEDDADFSAVRAILSMWTGLKVGLKDIYKKAMPRLRSGLKLQRCPAGALVLRLEGAEVAAVGTAAVETTAVVAPAAIETAAVTAPVVIETAAATAPVAIAETAPIAVAEVAPTVAAEATGVSTAARVGVTVAAGTQVSGSPAEPEQQRRRTCAEQYPGLINCSALPVSYIYNREYAAFEAVKLRSGIRSGLRKEKSTVSTSGPCPGTGMHTAVRYGGEYIASIVRCPCCSDTPAGAIQKIMFAVLMH